MRKNITLSLFIVLLASSTLPLRAQEKNVLQRAMQDELSRSMKELKLDTLAPPFYISYTVNDVVINTIVATLGGITNSIEIPNRVKGVRVLVGDYELNDESLDNNLFSQPEANEIALPLDDDYLGIRRSFWTTTDNVYKNAARQHAKNKQDLRDQKKKLSEVPHRTFAKVPVVQISQPTPDLTFAASEWEQNLRTLSGLFLSHKINTSRMILNYIRGTNYFINSEGTSIKLPVQSLRLTCIAQTKTSEGEIVFDQLEFLGKTPADLPSMEQLKKDVIGFIAGLEEAAARPAFDEEYSGPVLIEGPAVADVFSKALFNGREQLIADNGLPNPNGLRMDRNAGLDVKIGKSVTAPTVTVRALGNLESYKGTRLMGAFMADGEGVVPPAELTLIDKGILMAQLNDRTLTQPDQTANGHDDGPGVISVQVSGGIPVAQLKARLLEEAKKENLETVLVIRANSFGSSGIFNVYRVRVSDGKEEFLRAARFNSLGLKNLKKILASSVEDMAVNTGGNNTTSYITPAAILLRDLDVVPAELPSLKEETFVPSPLQRP